MDAINLSSATAPQRLRSPRRCEQKFLLPPSPLFAHACVMLRLMLKDERKKRRMIAAGFGIVTLALGSLLIAAQRIQRPMSHAYEPPSATATYVISDRASKFDDPLARPVAEDSASFYDCFEGGERRLIERSCAAREKSGGTSRAEWTRTDDVLRWNFRRPQ